MLWNIAWWYYKRCTPFPEKIIEGEDYKLIASICLLKIELNNSLSLKSTMSSENIYIIDFPFRTK